MLPRLDALQHRGHPRRNHVLVAADERNVQVKGREEPRRYARVLAENNVRLAKRAPYARRGVLEVADGRAHHRENACHEQMSPRSKEESATRASQLESLPVVFQVWKNHAGSFSYAVSCSDE